MFPLRRLVSLCVALIVLDVVGFTTAGWHFGWRWMLVTAGTTGLIGLGLGVYCVWRYGAALAASLDNDDRVDDRVLSGLLLLPAAFLLLVPGFITDLAGIMLLVPAVRHGIVRALRSRHGEGPSVLKIGEGRLQPLAETESLREKRMAA
jgi:UPF0716 protein FxsA